MTKTESISLPELLRKAQLSALPQSAIRLMELAQNPDNGPEEFARPLQSDPGLAGQILKFVNSSYFGFSREISSVKTAISLVGIKTINNFALWSAVFSLIPNPKCGPFDLKNLWVDSLRRALFVRGFSKQIQADDSEDLFTAALLQDIAVPIIAKELAPRYAQLLLDRQEKGARLSELEREAFGWDHAEAAGALARLWNLPEKFAVLLESHTRLEQLLGQPKRDTGRVLVALSSLLPSTTDTDWQERERFETVFRELSSHARLKITVSEHFVKVDEEYTDIAPLLKLPTPAKKLAEQFGPAAKTAAK